MSFLSIAMSQVREGEGRRRPGQKSTSSLSLRRDDERMRLENAGVVDAFFADELHVEAGQIDEEPGLNFVHALLENVFGLVDGDIGMVVTVHHRHGEE